jgi:hypothetical protein
MALVDGGLGPDGSSLDGKPSSDGKAGTGGTDGPKVDGPKTDGVQDMTTGPDGPVVCSAMREICGNGKDDNCNNLADCADPGCFGDPACTKPGQEVCNNGLDDDDDKLIDCADPDCAGSLACRPNMGQEICDNGKDDNGDKLTDCSDPQCTKFPACLNVACTADVDFGTIAAHGASVPRGIDTTGAPRGYATCAPPGGVGRVGHFVLTETADVQLDFGQGTGAAHVVALFRAGAGQACDRNPVTCVSVGDAPMVRQTFPALAAGTYWLIIESFPNTAGGTKVVLSTGTVTTPEICANGKDDDGNGLVDCQDAACRDAASCANVECKPDAALGALVIGAPAKNVSVDLRKAPDRYSNITCAAKAPGRDAAVSFTLTAAGGVEVAFSQTPATSRTIFSLSRQPDPGFACDDGQAMGNCAFEDNRTGAVAFANLSAGKYILIFRSDGVTPDRTAVLSLQISAFGNRKVEVCANGIDDDANGLIDCADPACVGIGMCAAPACTPDVNLGEFSWGTNVTTIVDTRGARDLYQTECGKGNGVERVLRLTVTQPLALGFDCTDSGQHIFQLTQQLAALDRCDEHKVTCVDPLASPFGCGFSLTNVQPGVYNLIVESFQPGTEGRVSLTLSGIREVIREICDNGIDDDKDGAIDCADRKCVTSPACEKFACRTDKTLGLLPLDGSVVSAVVQTSAAGDDQTHTACVTAGGGQDGDVDFQLPARSDLTLEWAQVGVHDFALYGDDGPLLSCEAGTSFACISSGGQSTGKKTIPALAAGRYHLVIDADRPGAEGGVAIQLSAVASP